MMEENDVGSLLGGKLPSTKLKCGLKPIKYKKSSQTRAPLAHVASNAWLKKGK